MVNSVGALLSVHCAHPPTSNAFLLMAHLSTLRGSLWAPEPLCREPEVTYKFHNPQPHGPEPVTDRHGRFFTSRGDDSWGTFRTPGESGYL